MAYQKLGKLFFPSLPTSSDQTGQLTMQYSPPQDSETVSKGEDVQSNPSINNNSIRETELHQDEQNDNGSNQTERLDPFANTNSQGHIPQINTTIKQEPKSRPSTVHLPLRKRFVKDSPAPRPLKKQLTMSTVTLVENVPPKHSPAQEAIISPTHSSMAFSGRAVTSIDSQSAPPKEARSSAESTTSDSGSTTETDEDPDTHQSDQLEKDAVSLPKKSTFIIQPAKPTLSDLPQSAALSAPSNTLINAQIPKKGQIWNAKANSVGGNNDEDDEDIDVVNSPREQSADLTSNVSERSTDSVKPSASDQTVNKAKRGRPPLIRPPLVGDVPGKSRKKDTSRPQSGPKAPPQSRNALYCICQKPYDAPKFMIACDKCNQWFHGECIGISEQDGIFIDQYFCGDCSKANGKSTTWKQRCANPACNKAARISHQGHVSKYCSETCGLQVARARLELADIKRRAAAPDTATVPELALAKHRWLRLESFAEHDDRQRLQRVREERKLAKEKLLTAVRKRAFLGGLKPSEDDTCGFDSRLTWADDIWQRVRDVITDEAGLVRLQFEAEEDNERKFEVCQAARKKCRHRDWQSLMTLAFDQERREHLWALSLLQKEREQIKTRMKRRRDETDIASAMSHGRIDLLSGACDGSRDANNHGVKGGRMYYTLYSPAGQANAVASVARQLGGRFEGQIGELTTYFQMSVPAEKGGGLNKRGKDEILAQFHRLKEQSLNRREEDTLAFQSIDRLTMQVARRRLFKRSTLPWEDGKPAPAIENNEEEKKHNINKDDEYELVQAELGINDPGFGQQWHLLNREQRGNDVNVTGVWRQGITGKNVVVAILDDGLDFDSEDIKDNFFAGGSYDFNDKTELPKPRLSDDNHGTRCAGEIAAARNAACGVGMAFDAKVAGLRILSADLTEEDEARALNYKYQENHIYSCSWGPPDLGEVAEGPKGIVLDAIKNGVENGRNGSGTIFVFASGNGGANDDNCNFDGYTNSIYTITVGAIDRTGNHPYYAERCSAQLLVTYSSGNGGYIYTTDVGERACTDHHGGTSAAAPLAAGVFALVLSVRPDLTWRDMQRLCVETGVPISLEDSDWASLPSGRKYSHKFGYGKLDAYAIVERAKTFQHVGPQTHLSLWTPPVKMDIPDLTGQGNRTQALKSTVTVTETMIRDAKLLRLEHVTATVYIEHGRRGDLEILLESPQGVTSQLGTPRRSDQSTEGLKNWTFMTVKHWDENPIGNWTLWVIDERNPKHMGQFTNWTLTLWGEQIDEALHTPSIGGNVPHTAVPPNTWPSSTDATFSKSWYTHRPSRLISVDQARGTNKGMWTPLAMTGTFANNGTVDRSVFLYTLGTLFSIAALTGVAYAIYQYVKGPGPAKEITAYSSAPQAESDEYEFDELQSVEQSDGDNESEPTLYPSLITKESELASEMLNKSNVEN